MKPLVPAHVTCAAVAILLTGVHTAMSADETPYSVPATPWAEDLGKHRALVQVDAPAEAVRVHIQWRRRDADADRKQIIIVDSTTGKQVADLVRVSTTREAGELVFHPATAPGRYEVYYLPYVVQNTWGWYGGDYLPVKTAPDADWLQRNGLADLATGKWRELPEAHVLGIQARNEFSRFDPMEIAATAPEVQTMI